MKANVWIFLVMTAFFGIVTAVYWVMTSAQEPAGLFVLGLSGVLCLMLAVYFGLTRKAVGRGVEDTLDAEIADGAGELGFFPPHSIWPFWAAFTISIMVLGPVFGWWIFFLGAGLGIWALCGWVFEYYRGDYAH